MRFWILQQYKCALSCSKKRHNDRKRIGDSEADVGRSVPVTDQMAHHERVTYADGVDRVVPLKISTGHLG